MAGRELVELGGALRGEPEAHSRPAVGIGTALNESRRDRAVDQANSAVVTKQQVIGDVADGRAGGIWVALDRQQELMLSGREPGRPRLALAPAQKAAQARAQL